MDAPVELEQRRGRGHAEEHDRLGRHERPDAREAQRRQARRRDADEGVLDGLGALVGGDGDRDVRVHVRRGRGDRGDAGGLEHREQAEDLARGRVVQLELDGVGDRCAHRAPPLEVAGHQLVDPRRAGAPRPAAPSSRDVGLEVDDRRAVDGVEAHDLDAARGDRRASRRCVSPSRFGRSFARWAKIPTRGQRRVAAGVPREGRGRRRRSRGRSTKSTSRWLKPSRPSSASSGTTSSSSIAQRSASQPSSRSSARVERTQATGRIEIRHQYPHRSSASSRDCQFGSTTTRSSR